MHKTLGGSLRTVVGFFWVELRWIKVLSVVEMLKKLVKLSRHGEKKGHVENSKWSECENSLVELWQKKKLFDQEVDYLTLIL